MSFSHGKNTGVAVAGYDISLFLNEAVAGRSADTAETSHFQSQAKTYVLGLDDGTFTVKGLFDGGTGAIDEVSDFLLTANEVDAILPMTVAPGDAFTVGSTVKSAAVKVTAWEVTSPVGDVVTISGAFQANGGIRAATLLSNSQPLSANLTGVTVDNSAPTGGDTTFFSHITNGMNGTVSVLVQQSTDGTTWVDFVTLSTVAANANGGQVAIGAGGTDRYLRVMVTLAGTTGTATVIVSASRTN